MARHARTPSLEALEGRQLLSGFYTGLSASRPIVTGGRIETFSVTGPGYLRVHKQAYGEVAVTLFGTTSASTLTVGQTRQFLHSRGAGPLRIASIKVVSGALGGVSAAAADLDGTLSPVGSLSTLEFADLGPTAKIDVNGSVGTLSLGTATLGPAGHVNITGDVTQSLNVGTMNLQGGLFVVGGNLRASSSFGTLSVANNGTFAVVHDVSGTANFGAVTVAHNGTVAFANDVTGPTTLASLAVSTGGKVGIYHSLTGTLTVSGDALLDSGGIFSVTGDATGQITFAGNLSVTDNAAVKFGRDVPAGVTVGGDLSLSNGGTLSVTRGLNVLTVGGDLRVFGGEVSVGGDLTTLKVDGAFAGNRSPTHPDLFVGLNLGNLTVLGGGAGQGSLQGIDIEVAKSILALDVRHGIFRSFITAGVAIQGSSSGGSTGSVGPDAADAVFNSEIRAGVDIVNLTLGGNVRSTFATDPIAAGFPTRIVAGEDRNGVFTPGGLIDNFQVTGSLIDAVIAASVAPSGGNGQFPPGGYTPPPVRNATPGDGGANTYDAPAGTIDTGAVGSPVLVPNYTEVSYFNETPVPPGYTFSLANYPPRSFSTSYNRAPAGPDPTIDDFILPGAINPSFARAPLTVVTLTTPPFPALPVPAKPTVLGGVISSTHGDAADYAGIFAEDTSGVSIGTVV